MLELSGMVGRQLPLFSLIVPFWLIWAFCGFRGMLAIWPAVLVAGAAFAIPQYLISNFHGPWLVDVGAAVASMVCLTLFLKVWQPKEIWTSASGTFEGGDANASTGGGHDYTRKEVVNAWTPWLILSVIVLLWGIPEWKKLLDGISIVKIEWTNLHMLVQKMPPVAPTPKIEEAIFKLNWLSATGTGIFIACARRSVASTLMPPSIPSRPMSV
jgi:lactate permease